MKQLLEYRNPYHRQHLGELSALTSDLWQSNCNRTCFLIAWNGFAQSRKAKAAKAKLVHTSLFQPLLGDGTGEKCCT